MKFSEEQAKESGYERAEKYLIERIEEPNRKESIEKLQEIIKECGPVVEAYPSWHPLVVNHKNRGMPITRPSEECGYKGLDHKVYFRNGFITCPYAQSPNAQDTLDSINDFQSHPYVTIQVEELDEQFYMPDARPILIRCEWEHTIFGDDMIPASLAVPLILEKQLPNRHWSTVAETWESMKPYFLGKPHGNHSSLFVNEETGKTIKEIWNLLINTGMFGEIYE